MTASEQLLKVIWERLRLVRDPEMGIDIVNLGLIYNIQLQPATPSNPPSISEPTQTPQVSSDFKVAIEMTLTSPTCPMAPQIFSNIHDVLGFLPGIADVDIQLVWQPAWSKERISEAGKMELGLL